MKLLSISALNHDHNICYYDGTRLHYHKLERTKQIKRYRNQDLLSWVNEINQLWNLELSEIDEIIIDVDISKYQILNISQKYKDAATLKINGFPYEKEIWYIGHHYSHALSSWMMTPLTPSTHIVIDGLGDARPWSVYKDNSLVAFGNIANGSIGWGMRDAGKYLGISAGHYNDIAGKVMALQSYGKLHSNFLEYLRNFEIDSINKIFSPDTWHNFVNDRSISQNTLLDWIHTVHFRVGELIVDLFKQYASPDDCITYSGGVAQNVIWNTEIRNHYKNVIIPPHSSDEGTSLGGIEWLRIKNELPKFVLNNFPYSQSDIKPSTTPEIDTIKIAAKMLADGKVIGWYQGNGEVGPRALGNRSILCDPRMKQSRQIVNQIKNREQYRPFGASVLTEHAKKWFHVNINDPYMLYTVYVKHDNLPGVTHVDGTCRIQMVDDTNIIFKTLLDEFYKITDCPVLLNTSLNIAGKPLAGFPDNAVELFQSSSLDAMFIGNEIYIKKIDNIKN
jgi:carbamoyltransferase